MGGPSIKPIEPLLHIRRSNRDAARSDAIVASINESVDEMLSIVDIGMIVIFFKKVMHLVKVSISMLHKLECTFLTGDYHLVLLRFA